MNTKPLTFYNSLTKKKETFTSLNPEKVTLYTCGPTVYNFPHIGNYRAYLFTDILKRTLLHAGYTVDHVMNLTDIDDKTIRDAHLFGKKDLPSLLALTTFYTEKFFEDRDALHILPAGTYTKATEYVAEMVEMVEVLLKKNHAYTAEDGSVYFKIGTFKNYGKLAGLTEEDLEKSRQSERVKKDEYEKDNLQDFALWKAWDEQDGEIFWETSLGKGRPGWHIECSAMSTKTLGDTIDIHTGGVDNKFPHHENEIAQSECCTGKLFSQFFMHNEWVLVDGKKMAKSAGNFYTLRDLKEKNVSPLAFRYLCLGSHYRTPVHFSLESVHGAGTALSNLYETVATLDQTNPENPEKVYTNTIQNTWTTAFDTALSDDLGTPLCLGIMWDMLKDMSLSHTEKINTLLYFDTVFGFGLEKYLAIQIPVGIKMLLAERAKARIEKNWVEGDRLRDQILEEGYIVKDTKDGVVVFPVFK
jgi:cysteinyl-tRNA synthetase